jgi:hypothetical protein
MQPYVIKQGDYLAKLAYQFGFDADSVWDDPSNADLRQLRPNPNILLPTDILYIPDPVATSPEAQSLVPGSTNAFVTDPPTVPVTLRFLDAACASQACTVVELPQLTGLTTDANGSVTIDLPVQTETFTVEFTVAGSTYACRVGHVDPIGTLSGIFIRLQNLGYIATDTPYLPVNLDLIRGALRRFRADQGVAPPADSSPTSGNADSSPPSSAPPSSAPPSSAAPSSAAPSSVPPLSGPPASSPASGQPSSPGDASPPPSSAPSSSPASDSDPPPSSAPPSSAQPDSSAGTQDDAGLTDDGTLDDATSTLLVTVHGS